MTSYHEQPKPRAIGIDIGGTKIAVAAVERSGRIAARTQFATEAEQGFDRALGQMVEAVDRVLARGRLDDETSCAAWASAAPVRSAPSAASSTIPIRCRRGLTATSSGDCGRSSTATSTWKTTPMPRRWASVSPAAARNCRRVVMLTLGTGVGGGVVIDGRVYRGTRGEHPELGHIPIDPSGPECYCGTQTAVWSRSPRAPRSRRPVRRPALPTAARFSQRRRSASQPLRRSSRGLQDALAIATWTILHTFMPELIVLGGGVMDEHYELLAPAVAEHDCARDDGSVGMPCAWSGPSLATMRA